MAKLITVITAIMLLPCQMAYSANVPQPYELTPRGNIASQANDSCKQAIESCYHGVAGNAPHGQEFLACLKQLVRSEFATLDAVYNGTISYLKSSAAQTATLRQAQHAWLQFQAANCGFARVVAPRSSAEEFYLDCILRSTIDRRVELRSLVGD